MSDRRRELLVGATTWTIEHGLGAVSLRPLAAAIGTSDRMLVYYFGSRDGLITAIATEAADLLVAAMPPVDASQVEPTPEGWIHGCWSLFTDPALRPAMAFLFELDAAGVREPGALRDAAALVSERWIEVIDGSLAVLGVPARRRRGGVTEVVASSLIGLVLRSLLDEEPVYPTRAVATIAGLIDREANSGRSATKRRSR